MNESKEAVEDSRRRLTDYVIQQVCEGISGRNREDIVDVQPSRALFAGVLQPPRGGAAAVNAFDPGRLAPADTALGLDFRITTDSGEPVRLKITPRWSFYYPVFPTFAQARYANSWIVDSDLEPSVAAAAADVTSDTGLYPENESSSDDQPDDGEETAQSSQPGRVTLPRVFRRQDVVVEPFVVEVQRGATETRAMGRAQIDQGMATARTTIEQDQQLWRHLSEPNEANRDLGDAMTLSSAGSYQAALNSRGAAAVALPPWSLAVQIDVTPDPTEPNAVRIRILLVNTTSDEFGEGIDRGLEERSIFDARVSVDFDGGDLLPFQFLLAPKDYRSKPLMPARGINSTATWNPEIPRHLRVRESLRCSVSPTTERRKAWRCLSLIWMCKIPSLRSRKSLKRWITI